MTLTPIQPTCFETSLCSIKPPNRFWNEQGTRSTAFVISALRSRRGRACTLGVVLIASKFSLRGMIRPAPAGSTCEPVENRKRGHIQGVGCEKLFECDPDFRGRADAPGRVRWRNDIFRNSPDDLAPKSRDRYHRLKCVEALLSFQPKRRTPLPSSPHIFGVRRLLFVSHAP